MGSGAPVHCQLYFFEADFPHSNKTSPKLLPTNRKTLALLVKNSNSHSRPLSLSLLDRIQGLTVHWKHRHGFEEEIALTFHSLISQTTCAKRLYLILSLFPNEELQIHGEDTINKFDVNCQNGHEDSSLNNSIKKRCFTCIQKRITYIVFSRIV